MPSNKKPPRPAGAHPGMEFPEDEVVWMACRATQGCKGNHAKVEMKHTVPMAGTSIRYKCLTCNKSFFVTI